MSTGRRTRAPGRDVVLDAAVDNFQRLGYHGTTMRDIARDAGMKVASIYHHFPSKQRILQDIMVRVLSDVIAVTRNALMGSGTSASEQLQAVMHAWALFHTTRRAEALIGASELRSLDEVGLRLVVALRDEQEGMFRAIVERGVAQGEFTTPYPQEAVRAIINMGSSIATWYRPGGELSPEQMAERYAALALGTVGAAARPT
ncbi:TetR family transcriptional regulator [Streptomyces spinoverrucosus]|uniref:TetR/AcrR family transcriptional regulator n=1 Tax=Streptomyces spinoverrucosus TaxID=284043 RepID=UPI0018C43CD8|nr:TetR/AcrR family transcriptional regulator [Streptomyces spinoverrucosus]MBG0855784.1 TetR family transcriptional regulator [Streptomyces spinoverrucosus]